MMVHFMCVYFQHCTVALTFRIVYLEIAPFCGAVVQADLMMIINDGEGGDGGGDDNCDLGARDYDDFDGDVHGGSC